MHREKNLHICAAQWFEQQNLKPHAMDECTGYAPQCMQCMHCRAAFELEKIHDVALCRNFENYHYFAQYV